MRILDAKVKLATIAFCKFLKARHVHLEQALDLVQKTWGSEE